MADYTLADRENATKFAEANRLIRYIRLINKKAPHLGTKLLYEVRAATADDYFIPPALAHCSKIVKVTVGEELCKNLSCVPVKENGPCSPLEEASYYYVGDNQYDIQCQPSCFHTAAKITYDEAGARSADVMQLHYNKPKEDCRMVNSLVTSYLEKSYYRSDIHYETRVNDMPTGFSRVPETKREYGTGFTYIANKTYCTYYDRTLDEDKTCTMTLWERLLGALIGEALINTAKSSVRMILNDEIPFPLPKDLPKLPPHMEKNFTLDGWRANINPDFIVPELIDTRPKSHTIVAINRHKRSDNLQATTAVSNFESDHEMSNFLRTLMDMPLIPESANDSNDATGEYRQQEHHHRSKRRTTTSFYPDVKNADSKTEPGEKPLVDKLTELLGALAKSFTESDTYFDIGVNIIAGHMATYFTKMTTKVIASTSRYLAKELLTITGSLGSKTIFAAMRSVTTRLIINQSLRLGARGALALAKLLSACASVVGWILIIGTLLDLLFAFWDPYGYNNLFPAEMPNDIMQDGEQAFRELMAIPSLSYKFENLIHTVLSENEVIEIEISSLLDHLIYLDCLTINSEGSRLDKGNKIDLSRGTKQEMLQAENASNTKRVKFNTTKFAKYNEKFMVRCKLNNYMQKLAGLTIVGAAVSLACSLYAFALVLVVIAAIVFALARLDLQTDMFVNLANKYTDKATKYLPTGFALT